MGKQDQKQAAANVFSGSVKGLANVSAVAVTYLLTPLAYGSTAGWVKAYTGNHYGYEFADIATLFWGILLAAAIFFMSRATLATAITMGGLAIAARMV
ncbi:hypothetical protein [Ponticaulis koreensis]|uniref:hypothetical protein n=1 Tax=Ponticaulis koreensis TaxID=1123045 RepID=UPI0003B5684F|nr:hypothetical protein [Ponticaulis koreensis]